MRSRRTQIFTCSIRGYEPTIILAVLGGEREGGPCDCGMRNAECGMRNAEWGMRNAECGMRNAECGMRTAECGMRNDTTHAFHILHSAFGKWAHANAHRPARSGDGQGPGDPVRALGQVAR